MSTEDSQQDAPDRQSLLTLEALTTVKGIEGPAVKPRRRRLGGKNAAGRSSKRTPRRRGIDAEALIRARGREEADQPTPEGAQALEAFDDAFPLPFLEDLEPDPSAPRTGPAKLPDLALIERLEAESLLDRPKKKKTPGKRPAAGGQALALRLAELVKASLTEASDHLLGRTSPEFMLVPLNPVRVIVALSGGRDSMALLDVLSRIARDKKQSLIAELRAVYVHHGLEEEADAWEAHCWSECAKRGVTFEALHVRVPLKTGDGIEAAARDARYQALAQHALKADCSIILTAHHEDDRVETFLLQWMRGAGLEGLAAFPEVRELAAPSLASAAAVQERRQVFLLRPWIGVLRRDIERYVKNRRIAYVDDPSNDDPRFARNRVRHEVLPLLEELRPGFRTAAARSVTLISEALEVLRGVAAADLAACRSETLPRGLSVYRLLELIPARQAWCLRAWLSAEGFRPLSKARLEDLLRQVRETHSDATFSIRLQDREIRRWGGDLIIREAQPRKIESDRDCTVRIEAGATALSLPQWGGEILLVPCGENEDGIARERLEGQELEVRAMPGRAKIKLWALRPGKVLKDLYAQAGIPAYMRTDMPKLWLGGDILFAAGLGMDMRFADDPLKCPDRVRFVWKPDSSLWDARPVPNFGELPEAERRAREARVKEAAKEALRRQGSRSQ